MVELNFHRPAQASKLRMREFFRKRTECRQIKISKNAHIYSSGTARSYGVFHRERWG